MDEILIFWIAFKIFFFSLSYLLTKTHTHFEIDMIFGLLRNKGVNCVFNNKSNNNNN